MREDLLIKQLRERRYMDKSKPGTLNQSDFSKVAKSALIFLIPLATLYLSSVAGTLQVVGHELSIKDFIPNSYVFGGVILYIGNILTDISRKFVS